MAIQDPEVLAWELYAEGVVTDSAIDKVRDVERSIANSAKIAAAETSVQETKFGTV